MPATRATCGDRLFGVRTHIIGAILSKFDLKTTGLWLRLRLWVRVSLWAGDNDRPALAQKLSKFLPR